MKQIPSKTSLLLKFGSPVGGNEGAQPHQHNVLHSVKGKTRLIFGSKGNQNPLRVSIEHAHVKCFSAFAALLLLLQLWCLRLSFWC